MNKVIIEEPKKPEAFHSSGAYWNERYASGGNSGSGSYNRLAIFKAEVINDFIKEHNIQSCIEWGCGDGNQLSMIDYHQYLGMDVSKYIIDANKKKFSHDLTKQFLTIDEKEKINRKYDMALSLDVIYHLVEDEVYETYMENLFTYSNKYVCIYASNENTPQCGYYNHMKHRKFTDYVEQKFKG